MIRGKILRCSFIILLVISISLAAAAPVFAHMIPVKAVKAEVRTGPSVKHPVIAVLLKGDWVEVFPYHPDNSKNGFLKIKGSTEMSKGRLKDGVVGWVLIKHLDVDNH
jgi:uncharacterized protein YgiM (DUF1202 family)